MKRSHWYRGFQGVSRLGQRHWIPWLLGIVATLAVLLVWQQLSVREQQHTVQLVQQQVVAIESEFKQELNYRVKTIERMANRWRIRGGITQAFSEADAAALMKDFHEYREIEWVDPSFHVRWVVPSIENQKVKNQDLNQHKVQQAAVRLAQTRRQPVLSRPVSLVQGGQGILAVIPLFVRDRFDGFIVGVFPIPTLFDIILRVPEGYQIRIYQDNKLIYGRNSVNESSLLKQTVSIAGYDANWKLEILANPALIMGARSLVPEIVLFGGLVGAWTLALIVYLAQQSELNADRTKKSNQQFLAEIFQRQQVEKTLR